jgi:putative FmdB family regulatory protein
MPIYEYRCLDCGEVFSQLMLRSIDANGPQSCSACGSSETRRLMSSFAVGNRADPGPGRAAWPTSWNDTNGGDPDTLRYWRKRIEREARLEEKYPELRDPSLKAGKGETQEVAPTEHNHHSHDHHHHQHDHPHSHAEPNISNTK